MENIAGRNKKDAYAKSLRVGFRPAFLGQYQGSVRPIPTFGGRIKKGREGAKTEDLRLRFPSYSFAPFDHKQHRQDLGEMQGRDVLATGGVTRTRYRMIWHILICMQVG